MSEIEETRQALIDRGYAEVEEHKGLKPGARVRHIGERFGYDDGTATVRHVLLKDPSAWSQTYRQPDVEVVVEKDRPLFGSVVGQWADYHCGLAYNQPQEV